MLIQLITMLVFFDNHWSKITSRLSYAVAGEIASITERIDQNTSAENIENIARQAKRHSSILVRYEPDVEFEMVHQNKYDFAWETIVAENFQAEMEEHLNRPFHFRVDFNNKWVLVFVKMPQGVLEISFPERRIFSSSSYIFLIWLVSTSFVLMLVAFFFMRGQVRPIRRLAIAAERFGKGQDVPNFKLEGAREVRQAGDAFLRMHQRIKRQIDQRTTMLAGVSHDLRTPLTRLKLQLAVMEDDEDSKAMRQDILEMEKMINGYLNFVQDAVKEDKAVIALHSVFEDLRARYVRDDVALEIIVRPEDLKARVQPMAFERVLVNLIENARRYAGRILLQAALDEDGDLLITLDDDGLVWKKQSMKRFLNHFTAAMLRAKRRVEVLVWDCLSLWILYMRTVVKFGWRKASWVDCVF